jgi:hypothetical protein
VRLALAAKAKLGARRFPFGSRRGSQRGKCAGCPGYEL